VRRTTAIISSRRAPRNKMHNNNKQLRSLKRWNECNNNQQLEATHELKEMKCTIAASNVRSLKR
jgi:hypothetical protein